MTGKASPAKAAVGDKPVFAYIKACCGRNVASTNASMLWRQDDPGSAALRELGHCVGGGFVGDVKLTFGRGTSLTLVPPVTPIRMGKDSRGVDLQSIDDLDERLIASWMKQATAIPGFGGKKK